MPPVRRSHEVRAASPATAHIPGNECAKSPIMELSDAISDDEKESIEDAMQQRRREGTKYGAQLESEERRATDSMKAPARTSASLGRDTNAGTQP